MRYEGRVFRPPSEAQSLILQATVGCAHNKCTFCEMYKEKDFHIRPIEDVLVDIDMGKQSYGDYITKFFIADGDALVLSTNKLLKIIDHITKSFPKYERIGIYGSPKAILKKSDEDLKLLKERGLGIVYLGVESGSDEILKDIKKGANRDEMILAAEKVRNAGLTLSITLVSGLGGKDKWMEHAKETGKIVNILKPKFIGLLTLMVEPGTEMYDEMQKGNFNLLTPEEVLFETEEMIKNINLDEGYECVFRSNHPSNYVSLKGTFPYDKERLLQEIETVKNNKGLLKSEWFRAL